VSNSTRSTSYDERYVVPLDASRRGAHRARVNPVMAALPVVAVAGIVVGAIALVYVVFGSLDKGTDAAAPPAPSTGAATSTTAAASPSPSGGGASRTVSPTASALSGTVDKSTPIAVFNGSGTAGLGRVGGERLRTAGFSIGEPATWNGASLRTTTVFYADAQHRATALAVVKVLGRGVTRLSNNQGAGVTVVIGRDFPGAAAVKPRTTAASTPAKSTPTPRITPTTQQPPPPTTDESPPPAT
jgi:hypothetical protein